MTNKRRFGLGRALLALWLTGVTGAAEAAFLNGPWLLEPSTNSIRLMWETDVASTAVVDYGTSTSYGTTVQAASSSTLKSIVLSGLAPNTRYYYSVQDASGELKTGSFMTSAPAGTEVVFASYGDNRSNPDDHARVANLIRSYNPRFVVTTGDYVENSGHVVEWHNQFFTPAADMLANVPLIPSIGNHDTKLYHPHSPVDDYFPNAGSDKFFSVNYSDIHIVVVNSNLPYGTGSKQYAWLEQDLAAATQKVILVAHHYPVYSSGEHGSTNMMEDSLRPLYERYKVAGVLNGHDHMYERSVRNGVQYFVLGGGGAGLYDPGQTKNLYAVKAEKTRNFGLLTWRGGKLLLTARRDDNTLIEEVQLYPMVAAAQGTTDTQDSLKQASPLDPNALDDGSEEGLEAGGCGGGMAETSAVGAGALLGLSGLIGMAVARRRRRS